VFDTFTKGGQMFGTSKAERDAAFTEFMTAATPSLLRTAWLLTGSADAAHDLVQAALVKTYAAWSRVRREDALAYARRVLVNEKTDRWRKGHGEITVADLPESAQQVNTRVEDRDEAARLLALLPDQQRRVIVLRYYNDLSEQAVAELLGLSVGGVKSSASRGLATLRSQLAATAPATPAAQTTEGWVR
jgi:RNA polymerase sigma-70 factor (sigma-E family)